MAGTMMACPQGMDVERAFYAALPRVATWRLDGEKLELFDAGGASVAEFESRYMSWKQPLQLRRPGATR
jgi:heat shock protein HslJ